MPRQVPNPRIPIPWEAIKYFRSRRGWPKDRAVEFMNYWNNPNVPQHVIAQHFGLSCSATTSFASYLGGLVERTRLFNGSIKSEKKPEPLRSRQGVRTCITCRKPFYSSDRINIQRCEPCKDAVRFVCEPFATSLTDRKQVKETCNIA